MQLVICGYTFANYLGVLHALSLACAAFPAEMTKAVAGKTWGLTVYGGRRYSDNVDPATVFDRYISPTGSNSNDGLTTSTPWAISSLGHYAGSTHANAAAIAGLRVGLLAGTYRLTSVTGLSGNNNDPILTIANGGSIGVPTIIESVTPLGAIITTNNGSGVYPVDLIDGHSTMPALSIPASQSYVTLRGIKFTDAAFPLVDVQGSHVVIEDCEISDVVFSRTAFGISDPGDNCGGIQTGGDGTDLVIRNCSLHDFYDSGTTAGNNNACVGPMYGYSNITVEGCTLYNSGSKRDMGGLIVRNNFIYAMQHYAIRSMLETDTDYSTSRNQIYNNLMIDVPCISGANDPETGMIPVNTDFYNNTVIFNSSIAGAASGWIHYNGPGNTASVATTNKYYNNILCLPTGISVPSNGLMFLYTATNNRAIDRISVCDWNCWGQTSGKFNIQDSTGTYTSKPWSASNFDTNSILGDPLFVDVAGTDPADFALQGGSPCLLTGHVGGTGGGAAIDMGCNVATVGCDI